MSIACVVCRRNAAGTEYNAFKDRPPRAVTRFGLLHLLLRRTIVGQALLAQVVEVAKEAVIAVEDVLLFNGLIFDWDERRQRSRDQCLWSTLGDVLCDAENDERLLATLTDHHLWHGN